MITSSIPPMTPQFSGQMRRTSPNLEGVKKGDTVFIKVTDNNGETISVDPAKLVALKGHRGETIDGIQVPLNVPDTYDRVDKITVTDVSGGNPRGFLTGFYHLNSDRSSSIPINNTTVYSAQSIVTALMTEVQEKSGVIDTLLGKLNLIQEASKPENLDGQKLFKTLINIFNLSDTTDVTQEFEK